MKKYILILLIFIIGCDSSVNELTLKLPPKDYGNGVYYFDSNREEFAQRLSLFIEKNDVKILAIAGDGTASHGVNYGYFVIIEKKVKTKNEFPQSGSKK